MFRLSKSCDEAMWYNWRKMRFDKTNRSKKSRITGPEFPNGLLTGARSPTATVKSRYLGLRTVLPDK